MSHSLVALPDKFRGSLEAEEVANALVQAFVSREPGINALGMPLSDGGQGTLRCLVARVGASIHEALVTGPYGAPITAKWAVLPDGTAVIECAEICGWARVTHHPDPMRSTTAGVGELMTLVCRAGHSRIIVAIGDTVTLDGGLGALEALAFSLSDSRVEVAADVDIPFTQASAVFGVQKGASPAEVPLLTRRLEELRVRYIGDLGVDPEGFPCGGSGGGLAGALACLGAKCVPGFVLLSRLLGLSEALAAATIVVTGEGRFDLTSLLGKATHRVLKACPATARVGLLVGEITPEAAALLPENVSVVALTSYRPHRELAIRDARLLLDQAAGDLADTVLRG